MGGLHPVVAVYATFLNRAFDQLLMDVALHRCGVTFVLDRAGVTGPDGPSHHGMWDMSLLQLVPGLQLAAPARRDPAARGAGTGARRSTTRPSVIRYSKEPCPADLAARSTPSTGSTCCCGPTQPQVLVVAFGQLAGTGVAVGRAAVRPGHRGHRGRPGLGAAGQPGAARGWPPTTSWSSPSRTTAWSAAAAPGWPRSCAPPRCARRCASSASPQEFLEHGSRAELLAELGLTPQDIARYAVEAIVRARSPSPQTRPSRSAEPVLAPEPSWAAGRSACASTDCRLRGRPIAVLSTGVCRDLTFLHWRVEPDRVARCCRRAPDPTSTTARPGWADPVPADRGRRSAAGPRALPYVGSFAETNCAGLSTRSTPRGARGVVFGSLEAERLAFVLGARLALGLNYTWAPDAAARRRPATSSHVPLPPARGGDVAGPRRRADDRSGARAAGACRSPHPWSGVHCGDFEQLGSMSGLHAAAGRTPGSPTTTRTRCSTVTRGCTTPIGLPGPLRRRGPGAHGGSSARSSRRRSSRRRRWSPARDGAHDPVGLGCIER